MPDASVTQPTALRRRPDQGGYARGEETRARIIAAALKVFGEEGYARASTRQIAAEAGVMPPALQYYFHSKEGLHRACAEWIIQRALATLGPRLDEARTTAAAGDPAEAAAALCEFMDGVIDVSLSAEEAASRRQFLARGQTEAKGPGFELIRDQLVLPIHRALAGLIGAATGRDPADEETRLRGVLILGQVSGLNLNSETTLGVLGWSGYTPERIATIKALVRQQTLRAIGHA